jgi:hypothetical protein
VQEVKKVWKLLKEWKWYISLAEAWLFVCVLGFAQTFWLALVGLLWLNAGLSAIFIMIKATHHQDEGNNGSHAAVLESSTEDQLSNAETDRRR